MADVQRSLPEVSVILCTYEREKLLRRAIESVLRQTFSGFELIVVDDGSTDGSASLVLGLARHDPRVVYLRQSNRGLPAARNAGIALARGTWVTFLDSDDAYEPRHLESRLKLASGSRADAIEGGIRLLGPPRARFVADMEHPGRRIHLSRCHIGGTLFVKKRVLDAVGGFRDLPYAEDRDLMLRIERRYRVRRCSERTYLYHLTPADRLGKRYLAGGSLAIPRRQRRDRAA